MGYGFSGGNMKRILGIILAILGILTFCTFLVLIMVADGLSFGAAILTIVISVAAVFMILGWMNLVLWLLNS